MSTKFAKGYGSGASAPAAGLLVINDFRWDIEAAANGDLIQIGELGGYHKLYGAGCAVFGLADDAGKLSALDVDVIVSDGPDDETPTTENTIFDGVAVAADTPSHVALTAPLVAKNLGTKPENRPIYLVLNAEITAAAARGALVVQIASYPG